MRNLMATSKVIGFGELVNECFQSGDLVVAQIFFDEASVAAGDADNILIFKGRVFWLMRFGFPAHEVSRSYIQSLSNQFKAIKRDFVSLSCRISVKCCFGNACERR